MYYFVSAIISPTGSHRYHADTVFFANSYREALNLAPQMVHPANPELVIPLAVVELDSLTQKIGVGYIGIKNADVVYHVAFRSDMAVGHGFCVITLEDFLPDWQQALTSLHDLLKEQSHTDRVVILSLSPVFD